MAIIRSITTLIDHPTLLNRSIIISNIVINIYLVTIIRNAISFIIGPVKYGIVIALLSGDGVDSHYFLGDGTVIVRFA